MAYQPGEYPLPTGAVYVWIAQGKIMIGIPPTAQNDRGHTVSIPMEKCGIEFNDSGTAPKATQQGWYALLRLLNDRAQLSAAPTIAQGGAQTQWQMEQIMKAWSSKGGQAKQITEEGNHIATMEELGL